ncbi:hypothetical protein [Methylocella silvestris]|uniref:Uncharacterized protein n=1 Tax=Methylocella silvestris TaxID=199596 RepID=A0A2J7TBT8_METSI|nr:hypothetical protein [Methylocella silvestris]PNG24228.1 hypothetical protein CR492_19765 [Methylocella silvestris]
MVENHTRRALLAAGSAGAVFSAPGAAASAAPAASPALAALIEAHRRAEELERQALATETAACERFDELCKQMDFGGLCFDVHDLQKTKDQMMRWIVHEKAHEIAVFKTGASPAMRERLEAAQDELARVKLERFEEINVAVLAVRERSGLAAAEEASQAAYEGAYNALIELCAFVSASLEEIRVKAVYLSTVSGSFDAAGFSTNALIQSLIGLPGCEV